MKILHLTHTDVRYDNRILKELEALHNISKYDVYAIGMDYHEGGAINDIKMFKSNVFILDLKSRGLKQIPQTIKHFLIFFELFFSSYKIIKRIRPQIIHCHDTLVVPIAFIYKLFNSNIKIIYDAHELESNKNGQTKIIRLFILLIEKITWRKIDYLITVSPSIRDWYMSKLGNKPSEVILNSPVINLIQSQTNEIKVNDRYLHEKYSLDKDVKVFIYLGALVPGRYIENILKIFSNNSRKSVVVFIGYGELTDLVKSYMNQYPRIKYHLPVTHDKVVETIQSADIGFCLIENVSLSDYFSLPNKLFEYAFAGKRVIASNFPDISEVVKEFDLGVCCELNGKSIENAIKKLEEENRKENHSNLYALSWEYQEKKLLEMYEKICVENKD